MTKTIEVKFDPTILPKWAQNLPNVVELCKRDLAYRVRVHDAKTPKLRKLAIMEADGRA